MKHVELSFIYIVVTFPFLSLLCFTGATLLISKGVENIVANIVDNISV